MGLPELSSILWRERDLLDLLLFKMEEERLVLDAGLTRWLPRAIREVDLVLEELQRIEAPRAGALEALAVELGLQPGRNLGEVAAAAPPPWDGLLEQHCQAVRAATQELIRRRRADSGLLDGQVTEAAVAWLGATAAGHDQTADPEPAGMPLRFSPGKT